MFAFLCPTVMAADFFVQAIQKNAQCIPLIIESTTIKTKEKQKKTQSAQNVKKLELTKGIMRKSTATTMIILWKKMILQPFASHTQTHVRACAQIHCFVQNKREMNRRTSREYTQLYRYNMKLA